MSFGNSSSRQDDMMSEINVTPLVDVMLVLLVIFILTAPLLAPQSLKINLPGTAAVTQQVRQHALHLIVNVRGQFVLDNQAVNEAQLAEVLKQCGSEVQLQIEADKAVPYGRVAELMAIAQRSGVGKLSFVTVAVP